MTKEEAVAVIAAAGTYAFLTLDQFRDMNDEEKRKLAEWGQSHYPNSENNVPLINQAYEVLLGIPNLVREHTPDVRVVG